MDLLAPKFHVIAVDSYGAGKTAPWPNSRPITLRDEVALIEPVLESAGDPFILVGHSYGAAVALIAALEHRKRVRAMALYEPSLFALVDAESPPPNDADGICAAVARAVGALDAGDADRAAEYFIDFWMERGAWRGMPEQRRSPIAATIHNIRGWSHALVREPTPVKAFAALDIPVLYMVGKSSPLPSRAAAKILTRVLPRVEMVEFDGLGHMAPVTHPAAVNAAIASFLERYR
jgi:pimeloyl-ACP methyl ester carboxylesterase